MHSETTDEMLNRLEHVSECVATRDHAIGRLIDLDVRRISTDWAMNGTDGQ